VLPSWRLGAFDDVEATLRHSLARLRSSPELTAHDRVRGFVFDPETGGLREIEVGESVGQFHYGSSIVFSHHSSMTSWDCDLLCSY
jgi:hypothetical protein